MGGAASRRSLVRSCNRIGRRRCARARRHLRRGSAPMKVLMTADTVGGVWTYALQLARAASDIEFIIATMGRLPSESQRVAAGALPNVTLVSSEGKLEWMDDPWEDPVRAGVWLLYLESHHSPDFIPLNGYAHGVLPFRRPK